MGDWTSAFVEGGGYDSMTGAFFIYDDGVIVAVIDLGNFGQGRYDSYDKAYNVALPVVLEMLAALNAWREKARTDG